MIKKLNNVSRKSLATRSKSQNTFSPFTYSTKISKTPTMCDDSKYMTKTPMSSSAGNTAGQPARGGKPSGIKNLKVCPQLDRGKWCQRVPRGHDEDVCHMVSQKRKNILRAMKQLVDAHVDDPVCPEWDTSETCENTPGPYRFGVVKTDPASGNENYKIIASRITAGGCECIKRNGLQDDCPLPRCRGSPECKVTPFPKCGPFLGLPAESRATPGHPTYDYAWGGDHCRCPAPMTN